jgi:hypothetical protein
MGHQTLLETTTSFYLPVLKAVDDMADYGGDNLS